MGESMRINENMVDFPQWLILGIEDHDRPHVRGWSWNKSVKHCETTISPLLGLIQNVDKPKSVTNTTLLPLIILFGTCWIILPLHFSRTKMMQSEKVTPALELLKQASEFTFIKCCLKCCLKCGETNRPSSFHQDFHQDFLTTPGSQRACSKWRLQEALSQVSVSPEKFHRLGRT